VRWAFWVLRKFYYSRINISLPGRTRRFTACCRQSSPKTNITPHTFKRPQGKIRISVITLMIRMKDEQQNKAGCNYGKHKQSTRISTSLIGSVEVSSSPDSIVSTIPPCWCCKTQSCRFKKHFETLALPDDQHGISECFNRSKFRLGRQRP